MSYPLPQFGGNPVNLFPLPLETVGTVGQFGYRFLIDSDIVTEFNTLEALLQNANPAWGIPAEASGLMLWNGSSPHLIAWNFNSNKTPLGAGIDGYGVIHPYRAQPGSPLILTNRDSVLRLRLACETVGATTFGMVIFTS